MRKARYVSMAAWGFLAIASVLRADPPPLATPADDDPSLRFDPDGVPLNVTEKKSTHATPEQIAALRKQKLQASQDKDWMLRAYEKQLQSRNGAAPATTDSTDPYQAVSAAKDPEKLDFNIDGNPPRPPEKALPRPASSSSANPAPKPGTAPFGSTFLRPLGTSNAAGESDFYSTPSGVGASPSVSAIAQPTSHVVRPDIHSEDLLGSNLDSPGAVAAGKDALSDPSTSDLTLNVLPGESIAHARAHQDDDSLLKLPLVMDAEELHRQQSISLSPSVAKGSDPNAKPATTVAPVKPPDDNYDLPVPVSQQPLITPVRPPIAGPFDILNR